MKYRFTPSDVITGLSFSVAVNGLEMSEHPEVPVPATVTTAPVANVTRRK